MRGDLEGYLSLGTGDIQHVHLSPNVLADQFAVHIFPMPGVKMRSPGVAIAWLQRGKPVIPGWSLGL